ncbi:MULTISPECIES: immunity 53 family protein [unclassified Bradyrhizobium]|uniref:immunity 53 family protein n=1 Tax=unclassified Bradyrhizobium TaxID=2631580 RepID=UPI0028E4178C|nr:MULTISPECIES: immunity 53 family protein [unclassified Bradyrhizobium]
MPRLDPLIELQAWYAAQCNGCWEHQYGVKIDTIDNPGWSLKIDLYETDLSGRLFEDVDAGDQDGRDWYICRVRDYKFESFCGPALLSDVISVFLDWAEFRASA